MKLEPLCTFQATLKDPVEVGQGPFGARVIYDVTGGSFEGPKLRGKVLSSGGDWILFGPDGVGRLDVRVTLETDDGARIYVQYYGINVMNEKVTKALEAGSGTEFGDNYFMTQPRFETGDERYAWLNQIVAVAEGRLLPKAVEYRVLQVVND